MTGNSSKKSRSSVSNWLALHDLDDISVRLLLETVDRSAAILFSDHTIHENKRISLSSDKAWSFSANAVSTILPSLGSVVDHVRDTVECEFEASPKALPFTRNRGKTEGTFVSICYRKTCEDLLCVAHEFGHALQIESSGHKFIPPVHREVAAFLSEMLLIEFFRDTDQALFEDLLLTWQGENEVYLGVDIDVLDQKLSNINLAYDYRMNYPLARLIAFHLYQSLNPAELVKYFSGEAVLSRYAASLS